MREFYKYAYKKLSQTQCAVCSTFFVSPHKHVKYCSPKCRSENWKRKYPSKCTFVKTQENCQICNAIYLKKVPNQKYCSVACRQTLYTSKTQPGEIYSDRVIKKYNLNTTRKCFSCKKKFIKKYKDQKYCTPECRHQYQLIMQRKKYKPIQYDRVVNCKICDQTFEVKSSVQIYCSEKCKKTGLRQKQQEWSRQQQEATQEHLYAVRSKETKYLTIFNELRFYKEHDFEQWFKNNYTIFGIKKLIKINRWFPDVVAEMYNGKILRIELELLARNFKFHKHDPLKCDLILCFAKTKTERDVRGVPVISIFDTTMSKGSNYSNYSESNLVLSEFMLNLVDCLHSNVDAFIELHGIRFPNKSEVMAQISRTL
jgi:hypothetical protein